MSGFIDGECLLTYTVDTYFINKLYMSDPISEVMIYQTPGGKIRVDVKMEDETVWLTQRQMAELFETDRTSITKHISNIIKEEELEEKLVCAKFAHTAEDRKTYQTIFYNLDMIISVGYRVNSHLGTKFRIWATQRLREYIFKGFALDDERLALGGGRARYFEELLQRIRDIRASERNFYQKVTDIYATSVDYQKDAELTREFFATIQNKLHYAVHGHTAAELIVERVDANKMYMGLTNFKGDYITLADTRVAKNYLSEKELYQLNIIVSLFLDFAQLQASNSRPMKMQQWIDKLDGFLKLSEKEILTHAGKISAEIADKMAHEEYDTYRSTEDKKYMSDFDREMKRIAKGNKP